MFALFLCFEFTVVSSIPLVTELVPGARGTMIALNMAFLALGRMVGAAAGPSLWEGGGMIWNCVAAATCFLFALGLLITFVREGGVERVSSRS